MFLKFSGDTVLVEQEIVDLLNLLAPLFSSPPLEIEYQLVELYIAGPNEIVPDSELDFNILLSNFATFSLSTFTNPYGVATLWITRDAQLGGNFGTAGAAYINGGCFPFNKYVVIEHITPSIVTESHQAKLWAHELGHIFNAEHAPQTNYNIMAPLVYATANIWTAVNISAIHTKKAGASCLIPCHVSAGFTAYTTILCSGDYVTYTDTSYGEPTSFLWSFPGGTPSTSTIQNPLVQYNTPGNYNATLIISSATDDDTLLLSNFIKVNAIPTVSYNYNITSCLEDTAFNINFGSPNGGIYSGNGISDTTFSPSSAGVGTHIITYTYTDSNSCSNTDTTAIIVKDCTLGISSISNNEFLIYPNPTRGIINIKILKHQNPT